MGSEGKPNNSKISPDTKKRKKELEKHESGSHRSGSFKLNHSLRLSLIGGSDKQEEEKIMIKAASILKSNKTEDELSSS